MSDNPTLPLVERLRADAHMIQELANEDGGDPRLTTFGFGVLYNSLSKSADALEAAQRRVSELEAALTPSAATKAAYIGEFSFTIDEVSGDVGCEVSRKVDVPWTTIKEIMAAILTRAALAKDETARE